MKPDEIEVKKAKDAVMALFQLNHTFKEQEKRYKDDKERLQTKIKNYMYSNGVDKFTFGVKYKGSGEQFDLSVSNVKQRKVIFDIPKLKKSLSKDVLKQVLIKEYHIIDYTGLVEYLKSCGVNPKKFLTYIEIKESVNNEEINKLGDIGEISMDDLKGCYEVKENEGYIKITELKRKENMDES